MSTIVDRASAAREQPCVICGRRAQHAYGMDRPIGLCTPHFYEAASVGAREMERRHGISLEAERTKLWRAA